MIQLIHVGNPAQHPGFPKSFHINPSIVMDCLNQAITPSDSFKNSMRDSRWPVELPPLKKAVVTQNWWSLYEFHMDVSENSGTPKSSILIRFSMINHPFFGTPYFWKRPYGNTLFVMNLLPSCPDESMSICCTRYFHGEDGSEVHAFFEVPP